MNLNDEAPSNAAHWHKVATESAAELLRVKERLGLTDTDTDAAAVIDMLKSWESDANRRADRLAQHLRNVLEIARTWQPNYATKMDRDTLDIAAAEAEKGR